MMSTKKDESRSRLFEAAEQLLLERGFHGVSLEDIAAAAGMSRQAVYKSHFASKAELLLGLVQHTHVAKNLDELTRPIGRATTGVAMLEETLRALVKIEERVHALSLVLSSAAASDAGAALAWRDRMEVKRAALCAALERVQAEGRFNPDWTLEEAADMLSALLSVDSYQQLVIERGWSAARVLDRALALCQASLLVEPASHARAKRAKPATRRARKDGAHV